MFSPASNTHGGRLYLATPAGGGARCVLKLMPLHGSGDGSTVQLLIETFARVSQIHHRHAARIDSLGFGDQHAWIAMEYLSGGDLHQSAQTGVPSALALVYLQQTASALDAIAYGRSKAALINLAETLYLDLAPSGIGVTLINPGFVDTPLTQQNAFRMPALISADEAAQHIIQGFAGGVVYTDDAYFKDPFNEVSGIAPVTRIFDHMFVQVDDPRCVILESVEQGDGAWLTWDFHFRMKRFDSVTVPVIRGATHLRFAADGRVRHHRDYWDAAEELYEKLPLIGGLMRWLKRQTG